MANPFGTASKTKHLPMKQHYLFALLFVMATLQTIAQGCLVDANLATQPGIFPPAPGYVDANRLIVMPNANVGSLYSQTAQIKVPVDTIVDTLGFQLVATIDSLKIDRITNLPGGINYVCDNGNCSWIGGANGCVKLEGTPTVSNLYLVNVVAVGYARMPILNNVVDTFYFSMQLYVNAPLSTENNQIAAPSIFPNPAKNVVTISNLHNLSADFSVELLNLQGQRVFTQHFEYNRAQDAVQLAINNLSAGLYIYQIRSGAHNWTGRLVVSE
jgi:hypothetical protein